jgi:cob(I)alamin adenosyltransferase
MKIYTKTGDDGTTSLATGKRVAKNHPQVEAYGDIDELSAHLGLLLSMPMETHYVDTIRFFQELLMASSAVLAGSMNVKFFIKDVDIQSVEQQIDALQEKLPALRGFIIARGGTATCQCHIARCVCRRAERRVAALGEQSEPLRNILRLLNRMSDYLFVLARSLSDKEEMWKA